MANEVTASNAGIALSVSTGSAAVAYVDRFSKEYVYDNSSHTD
jgi:hypothetical protein